MKDRFHYFFHGVQITSELDLDLPERLMDGCPSENGIHLEILLLEDAPLLTETPLWVDPYHYPDGTPAAELHTWQGDPVYRVPKAGIFIIKMDKILVFPETNEYPVPALLGRVLGLWLERRGLPVLHGSCISNGTGEAFAILGPSGMGKSTLSATFCNMGYDLVTDDLIPLLVRDEDILVHPGIPVSRIWPESGYALVDGFEGYEPVHPESRKRKVDSRPDGQPRFSSKTHTLVSIFLLKRQHGEGEFQAKRLGPSEALLALIGQSYRPEPVCVLGLQLSRLNRLARTVALTSVWEVSYPSGFNHLEHVCRNLVSNQATI